MRSASYIGTGFSVHFLCLLVAKSPNIELENTLYTLSNDPSPLLIF